MFDTVALVGTILHRDENKVCYTWKGWDRASPKEPSEGFGDVLFTETKGRLDSGKGIFLNINVAKLASATRESFSMQRCKEDEIETMESSNQARIQALIMKKLA